MIAGIVLAGLVLVAGIHHRLGRAGPWALAFLSVLWLVVNDPMEGRVLLVVTDTRGLTAADLAGLTGLALAAWLVWRRWCRPIRTMRLLRGRRTFP